MRKLICIYSVLLLIISLCACNSRLSRLDIETSFEKRETAKMAKEIVTALENKDAEALKNLFSVNAKKEKDLDAGIEYLMQFYKGKSTSLTDELGSTSEHIDHGQSKKTLRWTYSVKTEVETYSFDFVIVYNDFDKNDTGLFQLCIVKESDTYRNYFWILRDDVPGVLWDGILTPEDYAAGVTRALSNGDKNDVAAMFAKEAYQKSDNLTSEIETVTEKFRSYVDYDHFPEVNVLSKEKSGNQTVIKASCELETQTFSGEKDSNYTIYFVYIQDINNDKDGFYTVQIKKKTNGTSTFKINDRAGIFYEDS